jgi:predicted subunit of tRNA(5-methylaminomethyl-2-thiouridylate) methyltransferase
MDRLLQKYVAALLGFGFMAVALTAGLGSAMLCLVGSGIALGAVSLLHRRRIERFTAEFMEERATRRRREARVPV